jgi:hypothetical protein
MNIATVLTLASKLWLVKPVTSGLHCCRQDFGGYIIVSAQPVAFFISLRTSMFGPASIRKKTRLVTC